MTTTRTAPHPSPRRRSPAAPPRRRGRALLLVPLALIALAGAALVGVHYAAGSGSPRPDISNLRFVDLAKTELAGIPSSGNTLGASSAPATIEEYGDLRCPVCREFDASVVPDVVTRLVKTGKARLVYHHWPILGPNSVYASRAAYAAQQQDRLWLYAQVVYFNQGDENDAWFTKSFARAVASAIGLDMTRFDNDFANTAAANAQVAATNRAATAARYAGTPSLRIVGRNGQAVTFTGSVPSYDQIAQAVQKVSGMRLRLAEIALASAALLIAAFLTWERAHGRSAPCPIGGGGCETVAQSRFAELGGIPVSVFGMAGAASLLATFALRSPLAASVRFTLAGIGAVFSLYLTFLEATSIHAYCIYCLASATVWCLLAVLTGAETATGAGVTEPAR